MSRTRFRLAVSILLVLALYGLFTFNSFDNPIRHDEAYWVSSAASLVDPSILPKYSGQETRLYTQLLAASFALFGVSEAAGRAVGVIFFLMTLVPIYLIVQEIVDENRELIGLLACALYALHPLGIQVSLLLSEEALLAFLLSSFVLFYLRAKKYMSNRQLVLAGIVLGVAGLAKPFWIGCAGVILVADAVLGERRRRALLKAGICITVGISVFAILWSIYSLVRGIPILTPIHLYGGQLAVALPSGSPLEFAKRVAWGSARAVLWESPYFVLLGVLATYVRIREFARARRLTLEDFLLLFTWMAFFGFNHFVAFSVPRYAFPMMTTLSIVVAVAFIRISKDLFAAKLVALLTVITAVLTVYYLIAVGDLIYLVNYQMKVSLIRETVHETLRSLTTRGVLYLVPLPILYFAIKRIYDKATDGQGVPDASTREPKNGADSIGLRLPSIVLTLFVAMIASNIAMDIIHGSASYDTSFGYGARGTREVVEALEEELEQGDTVKAEIGITCSYNLSSGNSTYSSAALWSEKEQFIQRVEESRTAAIVYGPASNTVRQMKEVIGAPEIQMYLERHYEREDIGSYTVWFRKERIQP